MAAEITPGPGWWKASDGEWYPPRWEYRWVRGYVDAKKRQPVSVEQLNEMGVEGWEAVGVASTDANAGIDITPFGVAVLMKRPLRP